MPIVLRILSEKTLSADMDLSRTYLGLWCDNYGEGIVEIETESAYAEIAGFRGERGVRSWRQRVRRLAELGFLLIHERGNRSIGFVAIIHPRVAMQNIYARGMVPAGWWAFYQQRLIEVGAVGAVVEK